MKDKNIIEEAKRMIEELNERSCNLIHIINTIDHQLMNDSDNEPLLLCCEYFNSILYSNLDVSDNLIVLKRKLIEI
jgi:hypothetical protein